MLPSAVSAALSRTSTTCWSQMSRPRFSTAFQKPSGSAAGSPNAAPLRVNFRLSRPPTSFEIPPILLSSTALLNETSPTAVGFTSSVAPLRPSRSASFTQFVGQARYELYHSSQPVFSVVIAPSSCVLQVVR